jgi:hypothetical protein
MFVACGGDGSPRREQGLPGMSREEQAGPVHAGYAGAEARIISGERRG